MKKFDFPHCDKPIQKPVPYDKYHNMCHPPYKPEPCVPGPAPCIHDLHCMPHKPAPCKLHPGLVHPYNKVCFKNYEEAVASLKNKKLLAGEEAYAYYFDRTAEFGVNAIGAVGSIKTGASNIIFDNALRTENIIEDISTLLQINNEKIESFQNILDNLEDKINETINDVSNSSVNDVINNVDDLINQNASINERLDTVDAQIIQINDFIEEHTEFANNLSDNVQSIAIEIELLKNTTDNIETITSSIIDEKIGELSNTIENNYIKNSVFNTSLNELKTDLQKEFDSKLVLYSDSLTELESSLSEFINDAINAVNTDIYDINTSINKLSEQIVSNNASIINTANTYTDNAISDLNTSINYALTDLNNTIHKYDDIIDNVSQYAYGLRELLRNYIDSINDHVNDVVDTSFGELVNELNRLRQYLSDSIEKIERELPTNIESILQPKINEINENISSLEILINNTSSNFNTRVLTLITDISTYKIEVNAEIANKIAANNTDVKQYVDKRLNEAFNTIDNTYLRQDMKPEVLTAGAGININNNLIELNINANGVLMVNGRRYQLTEI